MEKVDELNFTFYDFILKQITQLNVDFMDCKYSLKQILYVESCKILSKYSQMNKYDLYYKRSLSYNKMKNILPENTSPANFPLSLLPDQV